MQYEEPDWDRLVERGMQVVRNILIEQRNKETLQELDNIRMDLLVWAGYHRGTGISEEAMPRFHEIIARLEKLLPDMHIVQGGTCWACGQWGSDMRWWHVGLYGDDGRMHLNKRMSYLIHKDKQCLHLAEQKAGQELDEISG